MAVRGFMRSMRNLPMEEPMDESKANEAIQAQLAAEEAAGHFDQDSTAAIFFVGDERSGRDGLITTLRGLYFSDIEQKETDDIADAKIKEYIFTKGSNTYRVMAMEDKPGEIKKWMKFFNVKCKCVIYVISLIGYADGLVYISNALNHLGELISNPKLNQCNLEIFFSNTDVLASTLQKSPFPLTETDSTTDEAMVKQLMEAGVKQRIEENSNGDRNHNIHYTHSGDKTLWQLLQKIG